MKNRLYFLLTCTALFTGSPLGAAVVTTADNSSTAADGQTSLLEALTGLTDNETITFNIPGAGPHYIVTPATGYPLITKSGVTIDGFSQPGAAPGTAGLRSPDNAVLRIVLDSRTEDPGERRTVIDFPGFGTSESCVLGLFDAVNVRIRGLAFIGVAGMDSDQDPYVYSVALIKGSTGAKIQGCWFGLDPAMKSWAPGANGIVAGVYGLRSAVASFKWDDGSSSSGLIFGTDGDGVNDTAEGNISVAQRLAVHLQTPSASVSGNWFNIFPDGSPLKPETQGLVLEDGNMEAIENGDGTDMLIGTDGDGVSDAEEGNIFGPVVYDEVVELWRPAPGFVFAGNSFGIGLDGFPAFSSPSQSLILFRKDSTGRIGSDFNGTGDAAEANHLYGLGLSFIDWHGSNNDAGGSPARISLRGNELIGNYGGIPLDPFASVSAFRAYENVMLDPSANTDVVIDPASTTTSLLGSAPQAAAGVSGPVLDVYLADVFGLYQSPAAFQGRSFLASFVVDGPLDLNPAPGAFSFDTTALGLTAAELSQLTATANYTLAGGIGVTTSFSATLAPATAPPALGGISITPAGADVTLQWTGGTPPFGVFSATDPAGPWSRIGTATGQSTTAARGGSRRFYRVKEGALPE